MKKKTKPGVRVQRMVRRTDEIDSAIDAAVAEMTNSFLRWPLPESVSADACALRKSKGRTGTNLMTCLEALEMFQDVVRPVVKRMCYELTKQRVPPNSDSTTR